MYRPDGADGVRPIPPELQALGAQVWALGLQAARLAPRDVSQIFTADHPNRESSRASAGRIRAVAVDRVAVYVPVWLECDVAELARRMTLPERAKLRDPGALRETLPAPPGALRIDTARLIASHAGALF